jgi:hypothetical protein
MTKAEKEKLKGVQRESAWRAYDSRTMFMERLQKYGKYKHTKEGHKQ